MNTQMPPAPAVLNDLVSEEDRLRLIEIINEKEMNGELRKSDTSDSNYDGRHMLWNTYDPEWIEIVTKYIKKVISLSGDSDLHPHDIAMLKYYPGPGMGTHSDQDGPCAGQCEMTSVIYLNDDYHGGRVIFPVLRGTYKVPAGGVMYFPQAEPWALHEIEEIYEGNRYAIITCYTKNPEMLRPQHAHFKEN